MIIRKKIKSKKDTVNTENNISKTGNVIKKDDVILNTENIVDTNSQKEIIAPIEVKKNEEVVFEEAFEKIDISSIEFKERVERRRGDRRRGYRRIDERSLVTRAQQEAHTIKELAAREGYHNGLEKAKNEIKEIKEALSEFLSLKSEMNENFFPHIMEIALVVAQKIIKQEVQTSPEIVKNIIMTTLDELNSDAEKITIKVNSQDSDFANASLPEIIEAKNIGVRITIQEDDNIEKGSCIVIANNGVIDANFKTQLAVLQNAFGIYQGGI